MVALDPLAELFDELALDHPRTALPLLVRAVGSADAPELGVLELQGEHPGSVLLGFTAPVECAALGVVTTGWSLPPDRYDEHDVERNRRSGPPAAEQADRVAVRSTVLVGRDCGIAGRLSIDGAEPITSAPESGLVVDLLLRALGCPTPPATFGTIELFATLWLSRLAAQPPSGWPEAARAHWALQVLDRRPDELADAGRELAGELDWAAVRRTVARAGLPGVCSAAEAAWFDDGSFARFVLGGFPAIADLSAAVCGSVAPSIARRVRSCLGAWGIS